MIASRLPRPTGTRTFRMGFAAMAVLLLALPAVAMQFSAEVAWGPGDFVAAGGLLALLGVGIDGALRLQAKPVLRAATIALALLAFLLVWAELAVGLFD